MKNLIVKNKKEFFENKLTECVNKPKIVWKDLKLSDLRKKSGECIVGAFTKNQIAKHNTKSFLNNFFKFFFQT